MQGTVLNNRYSIVRALGEGGMARVYLAHDEVLDRDVALKVLWEYFARDDEFVDRFKREARSAASLSHPNIVQVYDRGETESGTAYMAMECMTGGTLKERMVREGPLSPEDAASVAIQVAAALGAAHERGVVHRDIKPHNILLSPSGEAKVTDFGIARAAAATTATRTGRVLGTANYMSPEQALGHRVDPRTDLYSLGVVLFEMLTGELPFKGDSPITVSMKHINEPPPAPREIKPDLPEGPNALVLKLLAKDPDERYADAEALIRDLERMQAGLPPLAVNSAITQTGRATTQPDRTRRYAAAAPPVERGHAATSGRRRRRNLAWLVIALLTLVLVPLGALALFESNNPGGENGNNRRANTPNGPSQVQVPEVRGLLQAEAEDRLRDAGLDVGSINLFPNETIAEGRVIAPGYPVGKSLDPGTKVNLDVSTGPAPPVTPTATPSASPSASSSASPEPAPEVTAPTQTQPGSQGTGSQGTGSQNNPIAEPEDIPQRDPTKERPGKDKPGKDRPGKGKSSTDKPGESKRGEGGGN